MYVAHIANNGSASNKRFLVLTAFEANDSSNSTPCAPPNQNRNRSVKNINSLSNSPLLANVTNVPASPPMSKLPATPISEGNGSISSEAKANVSA